jgi:hypothetical protein
MYKPGCINPIDTATIEGYGGIEAGGAGGTAIITPIDTIE